MKSLLIALALFAGPVSAQSNCAAYDVASANMADRYGEYVQARAVTYNGFMFEIYVNSATGTWSILRTGPDGTACLVDNGTDFEPMGDEA